MRELCTVLTISSSFLQGKEITTRDLDVSNIKSVGKVTNQMGNNRQFRSPPLDVVCFIFCHYVIFFVYHCMINIANSFAHIIQTYMLPLWRKKKKPTTCKLKSVYILKDGIPAFDIGRLRKQREVTIS